MTNREQPLQVGDRVLKVNLQSSSSWIYQSPLLVLLFPCFQVIPLDLCLFKKLTVYATEKLIYTDDKNIQMQSLTMKHNLPPTADPGSPCPEAIADTFLYILPEIWFYMCVHICLYLYVYIYVWYCVAISPFLTNWSVSTWLRILFFCLEQFFSGHLHILRYVDPRLHGTRADVMSLISPLLIWRLWCSLGVLLLLFCCYCNNATILIYTQLGTCRRISLNS